MLPYDNRADLERDLDAQGLIRGGAHGYREVKTWEQFRETLLGAIENERVMAPPRILAPALAATSEASGARPRFQRLVLLTLAGDGVAQGPGLAITVF